MKVCIELTDEMVTALRVWMRQPIPESQSSFMIDTVVATLVGNALPTPDRTVAVTLPGEVVDVLGTLDPEWGQLYATLEAEGQRVEAEALRAVVRALAKDGRK